MKTEHKSPAQDELQRETESFDKNRKINYLHINYTKNVKFKWGLTISKLHYYPLPSSNLNAIHTKIIKILTFTITFAIKLTLMALKRSTRSSLG
jgi:hypothetical protein